jgi:predicted alpha/beta-fold hydrolase
MRLPSFCYLFLIIFIFPLSLTADEKIKLITDDGCVISGYENIVSTSTPIFLEFHGLGSSSIEWKKFNEFLKKNLINYVAIDFRGHGESIKCGKREINSYKELSQSDILSFTKDIDSLYNYIRKKFNNDLIIPIGASIGANSAMKYFYKKSKKIVLMSPGINYGGFEISEYIKKTKAEILFTVSEKDIYSLNSVRVFFNICAGEKKRCDLILSPSGHGVEIFATQDGYHYIQKIIEWIKK